MQAIINAQGAQVVGAVRHPFQASDFSSFLLQAQGSGANYVAFGQAFGGGRMPSISHAGAYSATLHYLKAVAATRSKDPKTVIAKMRDIPIEDDIVRNATLRPDGRLVHDTYLLQVKTQAQSTSEWDVYNILQVIPGQEAFRPLSESACPAVKKPG